MSQRFDLYAPIHKALRHCMGVTLIQLGRLDLEDPKDVQGSVGAILGLVDWLESHVAIEEQFVHAALAERRDAALISFFHHDHEEHERAFALLRRDTSALLEMHGETMETRRARARQLYLSLSRFVAENFLHMALEETEMNPLLWEAFSDEELFGIYRAILASERPEQLELGVRWLLPAVPPDERVKLVAGARAAMPAAVFEQLTQKVKAVLGERDFEKLAGALGLDRAA